MARPLRIEYDGAVHHVTTRGNARKPIFKDDDDRTLFLELLRKVNEKYNWLCHAYCLMSNHYHLVIETPDGNLAKGMRQLNGVYTQAFNRTHRRVGHIFQGRYKAILIEKESHLLEVCRYVVLNPVRARLVRDPEAWRWSSYRGTAGFEEAPACLSTEWILGQFGTSRKAAQRQFREFVRAGIGDKSVWTGLRGQSVLGGEEFIGTFREYLEGKKDIQEIPRSQRYLERPTLAALFGTSEKTKKERDGKIVEAVRRHGFSQREIADHLRLHYTTISRIMHNA